MLNVKQAALAILVAVAIGVYPQLSVAETFKSSDVLAWPKESQDSYMRTSLAMLGIIASQITNNVAECVDDWYFKDRSTQRQRHETILSVMRRHPDYHPQAVILAVIQKRCGKLKSD